jgi:rSAM/selenodomain-associated transferase 2
MALLSVIIPTLNEAATLPHTIPHTLRAASGAELELIVADCRSGDGTASIAKGLGATVACDVATCRADALNAGAAAARGGTLLFLHADTILPEGYPRLVGRALADPSVVGGAFDWEFGPHPLETRLDRGCLHAITIVNRLRFRWTSNFYGDQAIFVRREVFDRLGGFPEVRLMEDVRFCQKMKHAGRTAILRPPVYTSPRRFILRGVLRQFAVDLTLLGCDSCGVRPERLWAHYNRLNRAGHPAGTRRGPRAGPRPGE